MRWTWANLPTELWWRLGVCETVIHISLIFPTFEAFILYYSIIEFQYLTMFVTFTQKKNSSYVNSDTTDVQSTNAWLRKQKQSTGNPTKSPNASFLDANLICLVPSRATRLGWADIRIINFSQRYLLTAKVYRWHWQVSEQC